MGNKIFIGSRDGTHTVVVSENNKVVEFFRENESEGGVCGNIYKGVVANVVSGMQASFVEIGEEKNGYLFCGDGAEASMLKNGEFAPPSANIHLEKGDEVMVQVAKAGVGTKGPRVTTNVSVPGRYLVFMPFVDFIGISRKIESEEERKGLEEFVRRNKTSGGYIVRTNASHAKLSEILADMRMLEERWQFILSAYGGTKPTELCYHDDDIIKRAVRDLVSVETEEITTDTLAVYIACEEMLSGFSHRPKLTYFFNQKKDMFHENGLSAGILGVLDKKVELDSGAYLIIEHTEAMTVIDVNTGRFVGGTCLENTVFETNMEATRAVASQLRLRNIGGIIVVDFIDMESEEHKEALLSELERLLKRDRVKTTLIGMTPLGLVEITRTKTQKEMGQQYSTPCPYCGGRGSVMGHEALISTIKTQLFKIFKEESVTGVLVGVCDGVFESFIEARAFSLESALYWEDKRVYLVKDTDMNVQNYSIEKFTQEVIEVPNGSVLVC